MKNFLNKIRKYFYRNKNTCRLIEIDLSQQEVKFQIKMKLPILKCSVSQAINELNLISHISPIEACYLGGHYGRILNASWYDNTIKKNANKTMSFLLENNAGRYQILYKDRAGKIGFYDRKLQQEFIEYPLSIVSNENLVSLFNSSQACYIGILAGLQLEKLVLRQNMDTLNYTSEKKPHLRLIK